MFRMLWCASVKSEAKYEKRSTIRVYMQPAFLICAAVLAIAGGGMSVAIKSFGVYLKKAPLPLKKPLGLLDKDELALYKVVSEEKIDNEEIIKALGTRDYIQWLLEDSDAAADSTVRYCSLFITYYELPDPRVVHVPDECYMGSGNQRLASRSVTFEINKEGTEEKIPARYVVFAGKNSRHRQDSANFLVLYLFSVDGRYAGSREDARLTLNKNVFGKYSYFSKVEWKFFNTKFGAMVYPSKEEAISASRRFLGVILPVLEREHWPDWEK